MNAVMVGQPIYSTICRLHPVHCGSFTAPPARGRMTRIASSYAPPTIRRAIADLSPVLILPRRVGQRQLAPEIEAHLVATVPPPFRYRFSLGWSPCRVGLFGGGWGLGGC